MSPPHPTGLSSRTRRALLAALGLWASGAGAATEAAPAQTARPTRPAPSAPATQRVRRLALLVGTNDGGEGRARLRYAVSDAQALARVLTELGGVAPGDSTLLVEAGRADFERALVQLRARLQAAAAPGQRTEALVYYSGHADEEGLLLKGTRLSYRELRRTLDALPADVKISVIDSCASGAFARAKGGSRGPAFLVDTSSRVRGHAILTSSSEDEVSQESDRIQGSYFTHHLVSGLRGAADLSRDGRVTLNEAYHFAFSETLARTERTRAGPQHPAFDIELAGSGDLVMTDLRATSAGLLLGEALEGRLSIRDAQGRLVMELGKLPGRATEVGLAPGPYSVQRESAEGGRSRAEVRLADGRRQTLTAEAFSAVATEAVAVRGGGQVLPASGTDGAGGLAVAAGGVGLSAALPSAGGPRGSLTTGGATADLGRRFFNVGVLPPVDTNGLLGGSGEPVENAVSVGLLFSRSARLRGVAASLVGNFTDAQTHGAQVALGTNVSAGDLDGVQLSLATNAIAGRLSGLQGAAGVNLARDRVSGVQAALGLNIAGADVHVGQVAVGANLAAGELVGFQLAGALNVAGGPLTGLQGGVGGNWANAGVTGAQLAVGGNYASQVQGAQLSLLNVGGDVHGAQVGLLNVASRVRGTQVGLVNVAGEMDGVPVGFLSLAGDGQLHLEAVASDVHPLSLVFKVGTKRTYTLLRAGSDRPRAGERYSYGLGFGGTVPLGQVLFFDADASVSAVGTYGEHIATTDFLGQVRVAFGAQFTRAFGLFAGPAYNLLLSPDPVLGPAPTALSAWRGPFGGQQWFGGFVGVRI
jgi:hypothetical protein